MKTLTTFSLLLLLASSSLATGPIQDKDSVETFWQSFKTAVACPDAAGNEVVIYHFQLTRTGWKFTGLDNLNE